MSQFTSHTVSMTLTDVTIHLPYCLHCCHHSSAILSPWHLLTSPCPSHTVSPTILSPWHLLRSPFASHTVSTTPTNVTINQPYCLYRCHNSPVILSQWHWCHHSPAMRSPWHLQLSPTTRHDVPSNLLLSLITSHRFPIILSENSNRYMTQFVRADDTSLPV